MHSLFYLPTCVHTCTYTHVCRLATPHTCTRILCTHGCMYMCLHTHTHPCMPTSYSTHMYTHIHTCMPTSYSTHMYTHTHVCRQATPHTCTRTGVRVHVCGVASRHTWTRACTCVWSSLSAHMGGVCVYMCVE